LFEIIDGSHRFYALKSLYTTLKHFNQLNNFVNIADVKKDEKNKINKILNQEILINLHINGEKDVLKECRNRINLSTPMDIDEMKYIDQNNTIKGYEINESANAVADNTISTYNKKPLRL
jgi:hypothetical protein